MIGKEISSITIEKRENDLEKKKIWDCFVNYFTEEYDMPLDLGRWLDNDIIYGYETRNLCRNISIPKSGRFFE